MNCSSCGAPLPAKSNVCRYCSKLNEVDLRVVREDGETKGPGEGECPRCGRPLTVLAIPGLALEVDRCLDCHGIFFDPGELESALEHSKISRPSVDRTRLDQLVEEERKTDFDEVRYLPCPRCGRLMNRKGWGKRSGVVTDQCKDHGVWLDGGELAQLVRWARAGGVVHTQQVDELQRQEEERLQRQRAKKVKLPPGPPKRRSLFAAESLLDVFEILSAWFE